MTESAYSDGSITVFMTCIFLLLFALTGAVVDSARYFGSGGYVKASAFGADVAVYGRYNKELFSEYGLFGYGGFDGQGEGDWTADYREILLKNLQEYPEETDTEVRISKTYASVYQMSAVSVKLNQVNYLTEEKYFLKQLKKWIRTEGVRNMGQELLEQIQGTDQGKKEKLLEDIENAERKSEENQQKAQDQKKQEEQKDAGKEQQSTAQEEKKQKTDTVKNPLDFLKELLRDGILSLVCDPTELCEKEIDHREEEVGNAGGNPDRGTREASVSLDDPAWDSGKSGMRILGKFLKQSDSMWNDEMLEDQGKKGLLLMYASDKLGSYVSGQRGCVPYGLEYLASGQKNQKDAFAAVVNHLFLIRTMINFLYVEKDPLLQAQSLETATALSAALMAEAFIPVIQKGILLVLSLEESCVDIAALLDGRRVPVFKNQSTFQMKYPEICMAGKSLFRQKMCHYPKMNQKGAFESTAGGLGYTQYLGLMLMMNSWDKLCQRTFDVIQYDLRERYNATFSIDRCICQTKVEIIYDIPTLLHYFAGEKTFGKNSASGTSGLRRKVCVMYGYS